MSKRIISRTRQELLDNTIKRYAQTPKKRATNYHGGCDYLTKDGRRCAIGAELTELQAKKLEQKGGEIGEYGITSLFEYIPKRLKIMGLNFLLDIQGLHDTHEYWDSEGLTEEGQSRINYIKEYYNLK